MGVPCGWMKLLSNKLETMSDSLPFVILGPRYLAFVASEHITLYNFLKNRVFSKSFMPPLIKALAVLRIVNIPLNQSLNAKNANVDNKCFPYVYCVIKRWP